MQPTTLEAVTAISDTSIDMFEAAPVTTYLLMFFPLVLIMLMGLAAVSLNSKNKVTYIGGCAMAALFTFAGMFLALDNAQDAVSNNIELASVHCPGVLSGIRDGEIRTLDRDSMKTVQLVCGARNVRDAANSPGAVLKL